MNSQPTEFSIRAMYSSFIKKWGTEYAPDFKAIENDWVKITKGLSDVQVRIITDLLIEEMTGFPGTVDINKYAESVRNNVPVDISIEEKIAMELINHVCDKYNGNKYKFRVSDALEIAASVFYVHDNSTLESEQKRINDIHIMPRKSMFLKEASKWVNDSYDGKGQWFETVKKMKGTYDTE